MARSRTRCEGEQPDLRAEWRRAGRALLFFSACLLLIFVLAAVGVYH
jgi:hypothetical protein